MLFNSFEFFFFFAISGFLYGVVKQQYRWYVLLFFSLAFFLSFGVSGIFFLLFTTATTFFGALIIEKIGASESKHSKIKKRFVLSLSLILNIGILFTVKYFNFLFGGIVNLFGGTFTAIQFIVPLGISFYTFQLVGYLLDVYWGIAVAQKNFLRMLLFSSYFPQMLNGPISRYNDISNSLYNPPAIEYTRCRNGLILFAWGLFKKICIADNLKYYVDIIFQNYTEYHGLLILSGAVAYAIYLYADFGGCIDMARGISAYFGVDIKKNFERPYFATSVEEFWRRWHITLSTWFRDYLFYPLQRTNALKKLNKNLKNKGFKKAAKALPAIISLFVVWLTTGLWHGANLTYIAWGLYYGLFMILSVLLNTYRKKSQPKDSTKPISKIKVALNMLKTFLIVCIGYILFNAPTIQDAANMLMNLFDFSQFIEPTQIYIVGVSFYKNVGSVVYFTVTVVSTLILITNDVLEAKGCNIAVWLNKRSKLFKYILSILFVLLLLFMMSRSSGDFTYMQF